MKNRKITTRIIAVTETAGRLLLSAVVGLLMVLGADAESPLKAKGKQVYMEHCASCHGKVGEGVKNEYNKPLIGDKSHSQLTRYVSKWMPELEPELVTGEDAKAVSHYIYDAFYSPIAQSRNKPIRVSLSRLTVRQYRNSVTDIIASFQGESKIGDKRGLEGEYFKSRRMGRDEIKKRIDKTLDVNFADEKEMHDKLDRQGFSARWRGSIIAPDTGKYEFVIHTDQAFRLYVNDHREPLIDKWVKSGDETVFRGQIFLLEGRVYPIRVEFTSSAQGVKKEYKDKEKQPITGFIKLAWKRPHGVEEVIPERHLSPENSNPLFVVTTPFPPDDRNDGYERGNSISKAWGDATTNAAIETANYVSQQLLNMTRREKDNNKRVEKVKEICTTFVEQAFKRPLNDSLRNLYIERHFKESSSLENSIKRVVLLTMKSPRFLYVNLHNDVDDPYAVASRLSYMLWDSVPDKNLLQAAREGHLKTPEQVKRHAERMINDRKAHSKVRVFLHQWLKTDHAHDLAKDDKLYPGFDKKLIYDLETSLDLFLDDVVWGERSDFRELLLSKDIYMNKRLADYYGFEGVKGDSFEKVTAKDTGRAGVLTHPFIMASFSYADTTSPIHRGVFLARSVLGRGLRPPPVAVAPLIPDLHPDMTTRERVAKQTSDRVCMSCHGLINHLGFALEHFDATGKFREKEKDKPINAEGYYIMASGDKMTFEGSTEMAKFLATNRESHRAFVVQLYHYLVKQPIYAYGMETPNELVQLFEKNDFHIRHTIRDMVTKAALADLSKNTGQVKANEPAEQVSAK